MHTSGVLATMSRDERDDAAGEVIVEWLASAGQQGRHALPESLVDQARKISRTSILFRILKAPTFECSVSAVTCQPGMGWQAYS